MASVYQNKKSKTWEFVFDRYVNGRRKQIRRRGFRTKREAEGEMIRLQSEVRDETYVGRSRKTVGEFMKYWLDNIRKLECEETSFYNYSLILKNHIIPKWGILKLQELDLETCQKFVNDMHEQGYARNTIDRVCTMIKLALDTAVDYKYMKENCMRKIKLPKRQRREMKVWTAEQANHFLRCTAGRRFHCAYALALMTGMRQGEILGLRWKDVHFDRKTITVSQTLTHYGKSLKSGAKSRAGERTISLPEQLVALLIQRRNEYDAFKRRIGSVSSDHDLVIYNLKDGGTVFPSNLTKAYLHDVRSSGLPHIPFHSLRHTHATLLIEKNVNVKMISERLGHSKVGITLDVYSHVLPSMQQEVADKVDEIIRLQPGL